MTYQEYSKRYQELWEQAETLPKVEAFEKLKECAKLKAEFYREHSQCITCEDDMSFCSKELRKCDQCIDEGK